MKIVILANSDLGLYKFRKELLEELLKKYEVYLVLPDGNFVKYMEAMGCIHINIKLERRGTSIKKDLRLFCQYWHLLKNIKPDAVLTYTIKPNIYGGMATAINHIPYLVNITGLGSAVENPGRIQKLTILLYKIALKRCRKVFFQNQGNAAFFVEHKINVNHEILPGSGVNLGYYTPLPYPKGQAVRFVFISRIMREKGIEQFLEAANIIKKKYLHTEFHICGFCEEKYEERIHQEVSKGTVLFHGMVEDTRAILKNMHCTIHPSFYPEGMSNVCLESAASGRPVITTNRSGLRETVDDNVSGYLVKERDVPDLVMKLESFLALTWEQKKAMGQAGRMKMESEFDRNIVVKKYMEELAQITGSISGLK